MHLGHRSRHKHPVNSPVAALIGGILALGFGLFSAHAQWNIHMHGTRVLARIASVSRGGRHQSSSTRLTFTTTGGTASECVLSGALGDVGRPVWIRYLPRDPSHCGRDALGPSLTPAILLSGFGIVLLSGSLLLYRRAQRGESVRNV